MQILPGILCAAGCTPGDGIANSYYAPRPSYSYTDLDGYNFVSSSNHQYYCTKVDDQQLCTFRQYFYVIRCMYFSYIAII